MLPHSVGEIMDVKPKRGISLGIRLSVILGAVLIVIFGVYSVSAILIWEHFLVEHAITDSERFCDTLKRSTQNAMMKAHSAEINEIIATVGAQKDVRWVRIFNKDGKVMYSTKATEVGTTIDKKSEACYRCHATTEPLNRLTSLDRSRILESGERILATIEPIYNEPSCFNASCHYHAESQQVLGVLDVAISLTPMDTAISTRTRGLWVIGISSILAMSALLWFFIRRYVGKPVRQLVLGTEKIAGGDMSYRIPVIGTDEFAGLAASFNTMTESLGNAHGELQRWAETLETRVEEKTLQLRDAQRQIVRAEKLASLGRLAAGVAHELNNPLTGIVTFAHFLRDKTPADSQERSDAETIINEANRCAKIIKELLDFARETRTERRAANINAILAETLSLVRHQSIFHNINMEFTPDKDLPGAVVDASQMKQVFMNIIINAAESMPTGGDLKIATSLENSHMVRISISDTGSGISSDNLGKIFDPFFTTKEPGKGTGLGLAVSLKLVENHGGTISVESVVGKGSIFHIFIPLNGAANENSSSR